MINKLWSQNFLEAIQLVEVLRPDGLARLDAQLFFYRALRERQHNRTFGPETPCGGRIIRIDDRLFGGVSHRATPRFVQMRADISYALPAQFVQRAGRSMI